MQSNHSAMYSQIKGWYDCGFWTKAMVRNAVIKKKLTEEEYELIIAGETSEGGQ